MKQNIVCLCHLDIRCRDGSCLNIGIQISCCTCICREVIGCYIRLQRTACFYVAIIGSMNCSSNVTACYQIDIPVVYGIHSPCDGSFCAEVYAVIHRAYCCIDISLSVHPGIGVCCVHLARDGTVRVDYHLVDGMERTLHISACCQVHVIATIRCDGNAVLLCHGYATRAL